MRDKYVTIPEESDGFYYAVAYQYPKTGTIVFECVPTTKAKALDTMNEMIRCNEATYDHEIIRFSISSVVVVETKEL